MKWGILQAYTKYKISSRFPTLTCSASVLNTSMEAEPSRKNRPRVSFSRHMSRTARAVLPVSLRECTNIKTCQTQSI